MQEKGVTAVIEEYIFSLEANFADRPSGGKTEMLGRFCADLIHPLILVGYGCEFNMPGLVIEGRSHIHIHSLSRSDSECIIQALDTPPHILQAQVFLFQNLGSEVQ